MLDKERIDCFPRSVLEVQAEYQVKKHLNIAIEESALIHYPTAYYFSVSPDNELLTENIRLGLEPAISDGSFDRIFKKHYGEIVKSVRTMNRRMFSLNNRLLPQDLSI